MQTSKITFKPLNEFNREVYVDGLHAGYVLKYSIPREGWAFRTITGSYADSPLFPTIAAAVRASIQ
jgi:hypothetical protein